MKKLAEKRASLKIGPIPQCSPANFIHVGRWLLRSDTEAVFLEIQKVSNQGSITGFLRSLSSPRKLFDVRGNFDSSTSRVGLSMSNLSNTPKQLPGTSRSLPKNLEFRLYNGQAELCEMQKQGLLIEYLFGYFSVNRPLQGVPMSDPFSFFWQAQIAVAQIPR
jgi:hypothetical protein